MEALNSIETVYIQDYNAEEVMDSFLSACSENVLSLNLFLRNQMIANLFCT